MNMIFMVGLMVLVFFTSLVVMCHYRDKMDPRIWNLAFIIADLAFYFCWNYAAYERGWLDEGWMTLENISPLVCTVIPLTLIMNDKVKQAAYDALSSFSVGLFAALMISPEHAYLFNFNIEANFLYTSEAACHLVAALFGIYLVLSRQVKPDFKAWVRACIFSYSIIGFGLFLNYVFHKSHFGMDPYGSSAIYMIDIFGSNIATMIAYLAGVMVVITVGLQCMYALISALAKAGGGESSVRAGRETVALAGEAEISGGKHTVIVREVADGKPSTLHKEMRVYLFDFDGTLVDSMPTYGNMIISLLEREGVEYPEDVVKITTPLGYAGAAEYLRGIGVRDDVEKIMADMKAYSLYEYENNIPAKDGVKEALSELRARGASLNVLTASPHDMLDPCLKRLGIYELFDNVWSSDDFTATKADPEIYRMAAERLGVPTSEVLFVDDNLGAVSTAARAGMVAFGVFDESSADAADKIKSVADGYIYNFRELI